MDIDKDEIAEEIQHHTEMLRVLRRRLRERELQEVKHGINVPPEITSDLHDLTERVQRHESEITRLQTLAAEDKEPLGEVEYRAVLAEIWEKSEPTYAGLTRLELIRLRHGILRERANELEKEVRAIVARELPSTTQAINSIVFNINRIRSYYTENNNIDIKKITKDREWKLYRRGIVKELDASTGTYDVEASIKADYEAAQEMISEILHEIGVAFRSLSYPLQVNEHSIHQLIVSIINAGDIILLHKSLEYLMDNYDAGIFRSFSAFLVALKSIIKNNGQPAAQASSIANTNQSNI
jgi:hypothetical protein